MTDAKKRAETERKAPEGKKAAPETKKPAPEAKKVAAGKKAAPETVAAPERKAPGPERKAQAPEPKAPAAAPAEPTVRAPARLKDRYRAEAVPRLRERFRYRNVMEVPRLEKVVINVRVGDATTDSRFLDKAAEELAVIAGQRPVIPRAKKSIAACKLRRGLPIAAKVTLRGDRMYQFVDKLFNI